VGHLRRTGRVEEKERKMSIERMGLKGRERKHVACNKHRECVGHRHCVKHRKVGMGIGGHMKSCHLWLGACVARALGQVQVSC